MTTSLCVSQQTSLEDVAFEIMAVGDGGKLWFEVGVWYVPRAQCETQLEMGVAHHLNFPIFQFGEVVTILTT